MTTHTLVYLPGEYSLQDPFFEKKKIFQPRPAPFKVEIIVSYLSRKLWVVKQPNMGYALETTERKELNKSKC